MTADPAPAAPAPAVTIRVAEPREYDAVRALLLRAYESRFWITSSYRESLLDIEGHVADHGPDGPRGEDLVLAVDDAGDAGDAGDADDAGDAGRHRILGAVFVPRDTQTGPDGAVEQSFGRLGVAPEAAGRGIARVLVEHIEALARGRGASRIAIHSGPQMHGAHRMYEHLGYLRRPEREDLVVDSGQRLLVYTRELGEPEAMPRASGPPARPDDPRTDPALRAPDPRRIP